MKRHEYAPLIPDPSADRLEEVLTLNSQVEPDEDILSNQIGIWILRLPEVNLFEVRLYEPSEIKKAS